MTATSGTREFGAFKFDIESGELTGPSGKVRLQPQPAQVLRALLERPGELVLREELKQTVWPDTNVEADQGLNYCVRQIRIALGEDGNENGLIETLPRRGYRLRMPVDSDNTTLPIKSSADDAVGFPRTQKSRNRAILFGLAAVALFVVALFIFRQGAGTASTTVSDHIAVLPFATNGDSEWANQLNRDFTEQFVVRLTNDSVGKWNVVGSATTGRYFGDTRAQTLIGTELNVQYVASGGVRLSDSTLFVQMIRVIDGVHVFAWREKIGSKNASDLANASAAALQVKFQRR
ncbi:MAG: winged helix-turn-helix domain-containing protein [Gemmatimonadaceae bacterium]